MDQYLIVKGKAGLGNRMLCAVTAILYARLAKRTLVVDWSDFTYSSDGSNVFPRLFSCPDAADPPRAAPQIESVAPAIWRGRLHKSANDLLDEFDPDKHSSSTIYRKYSVDLNRLDHPEQVLVMWCFSHQIRSLRPHFKGAFSGYAPLSDQEILSKVLKEDIVPHVDIRLKVDDYARRFFTKPTIGVHVRFMDRKSRIDDFYRYIDKARSQAPQAQIFLATDNREAEDCIRQRYGTVIATEKWFPDSGVSMHQNPQCPDRLNNAVEALVDMYLLAKCDYLIYPGSSTFSQISALASDIPEKHIFDVESRNVRIRIKKLVRAWLAR